MKLNPPIIALLLFASFQLHAQEEAGENSTVQIGVNATAFINTFLSFNENNSPTGNYLFSLKTLSDNKGFRMGLGFGLSKIKSEIDANQEDRINKNNFINLRWGYEWQFPILQKWLVYTGFDILLGYAVFETTFDPGFGEVITKQRSLSGGAGGVLGIQFNINDRISLATESTLYYTHIDLKDEQKFGNNGQDDIISSSSRSDFVSISLPTSLFFQISF